MIESFEKNEAILLHTIISTSEYKVGNALKLISQRLSDELVEEKGFAKSVPSTFDLLKLMSEEWDREVKEIEKEYWKKLLKER